MVKEKPNTIQIPSDVQKLLKGIHHAGFSVWVVGGAVRDFLLGLSPKDWDLATNASPQDVIELFERVIPVGIRHGTVQVLTGRRTVEVTSYIGAGWEGILVDLERRDFTVNAIALAYPSLKLVRSILWAARHRSRRIKRGSGCTGPIQRGPSTHTQGGSFCKRLWVFG